MFLGLIPNVSRLEPSIFYDGFLVFLGLKSEKK